MKQEYTEIKTYCDCCGEEITIPSIVRNDGSFQHFHIRKHDKDICLKCSALILSKIELNEDDFNKTLEEIKNRNFDKPSISLDISFPSI